MFTWKGAAQLERVPVSLQEGRHLLQTADRQLISGAQRVLAVVLVDAAMGPPGARWAPVAGVAIGGKATSLPDETERGEGGEPVEPLPRIRHQLQLAFLRDF
jgi:hypothetical protein